MLLGLLPLSMFVLLNATDGSFILLNPGSIVTMRAPKAPDHVGPGVRCLIRTDDGKFVATADDCEHVRELVDGGLR